MMNLSKKKQAIIFIIGSIMNLLLFCITKYTAFPLWLDYAGTLYISVLCGPILGTTSLIIHTLLLCLLIDKAAALLPALAIIAIIFVIWFIGKDDSRSVHRSITIGFVSTITAIFINTIIFVCCDSPLGRYAYYTDIFSAATQSGGKFFASLFLASGISIEFILMFTVVEIAWILTPKRADNLIFKK